MGKKCMGDGAEGWERKHRGYVSARTYTPRDTISNRHRNAVDVRMVSPLAGLVATTTTYQANIKASPQLCEPKNMSYRT